MYTKKAKGPIFCNQKLHESDMFSVFRITYVTIVLCGVLFRLPHKLGNE